MIDITVFGTKDGLKDWIVQRFSGIYILFYFLFIICYLFYSGGLIYSNWAMLFSFFYFKIATILFIFNLSVHINIGMRIIIINYIKNTLLKIISKFIINLILLVYVFFILQILWGF